MQLGRFSLLSRLCAVCLLVSTFFTYVLATQNTAPANRQFIPLLRKKADVVQAKISDATRPKVTIRLNDLQPTDFVNLRPETGSQISVAVGTLEKTIQPGETFSLYHHSLKAGTPLPDSSLEVANDGVTFNRPAVAGEVVFLDVQVPRNVKVRVIVNGEKVLSAALQQPLLFHDQEWEQGSPNASGTFGRAAGLTAKNLRPASL